MYLKTPPTLADLTNANKAIVELKTKKSVALELLEKHKKPRTFLEKFAHEFKNRMGIKPKQRHLQYALDKYRETALEKAEKNKKEILMRIPLVIEIKE